MGQGGNKWVDVTVEHPTYTHLISVLLVSLAIMCFQTPAERCFKMLKKNPTLFQQFANKLLWMPLCVDKCHTSLQMWDFLKIFFNFFASHPHQLRWKAQPEICTVSRSYGTWCTLFQLHRSTLSTEIVTLTLHRLYTILLCNCKIVLYATVHVNVNTFVLSCILNKYDMILCMMVSLLKLLL